MRYKRPIERRGDNPWDCEQVCCWCVVLLIAALAALNWGLLVTPDRDVARLHAGHGALRADHAGPDGAAGRLLRGLRGLPAEHGAAGDAPPHQGNAGPARPGRQGRGLALHRAAQLPGGPGERPHGAQCRTACGAAGARRAARDDDQGCAPTRSDNTHRGPHRPARRPLRPPAAALAGRHAARRSERAPPTWSTGPRPPASSRRLR